MPPSSKASGWRRCSPAALPAALSRARYPLATSLWIGAIVQAVANLCVSAGWRSSATNPTALAIAITLENFTSAIGTVMFVAYLSALCQNPLHTATQYALLTALAAVGRTYLSSGAGFIAEQTGWVWFFVICALAGLPSLSAAGLAAAARAFQAAGAAAKL